MEKVHTQQPVNQSIASSQTAIDENPLLPDLYQEGINPVLVQRKLSVGAVDDPLETEADAMADKVIRMPENSFIQRKCKHCEEEEKVQRKPLSSFIQRKESQSAKAVSDSLSQSIYSSQGKGNALPASTKSFMESRFGADFSEVRIHNDNQAASLSQQLNAKAFTVGRDIYFNNNQYAPLESSSMHLLAHELTHTIQQGATTNSIQREEGTSRVEEHVQTPTQTGDTWSGTVDREEYVPASGSTPRRTLGTMSGIRVEFNSSDCVVTLPTRVKFEHPSTSNWPFCSADSGSAPPAAVEQSIFDRVKQRFLSLTQSWFDNWFTVRLSNCENACAGKDIPIRASIAEDDANPTTTVIIANKAGRSCANSSKVVLHVGNGIADDRIVHEAGHMALGYGDEYPSAPDTESVRRGDTSMAGSHSSFQDWMLLHERHFAFVPAFLQQIYPGCTATLQSNNRSGTTFNFPALMGYSGYRGGGVHFSTGLDLAVPLEIQRRLQLTLGARAHYILGASYPTQHAFMGGLRLGLNYTSNFATGGLRLGGFGEIGASFSSATDRTSPDLRNSRWFGGGYYSVGGMLGYTSALSGGSSMFIGAEASYNSSILSEDNLRRFGPAEWFNLGLSFGYQWR
jgi:hypothetical protein